MGAARRRDRGGAAGRPRARVTLARVAVPALLRRPAPRTGRFLAVASAAATRGLPMLAAYCAAKAGVAGLVRALAVELRGTGVTANAVSPGSTDTPVLAESAGLYGLPTPRTSPRQQPLGRLLEPGRGRRRAGLAGRRGQQRDHRRGAAGRRRPRPVTVRPSRQAGRWCVEAWPGSRGNGLNAWQIVLLVVVIVVVLAVLAWAASRRQLSARREQQARAHLDEARERQARGGEPPARPPTRRRPNSAGRRPSWSSGWRSRSAWPS